MHRVRLLVTGGLVAALVVAGGLYATHSPAAGTTSVTAAQPVVAPAPASTVPAGFVPAWQAASGATLAPVVAGPAVVTADGSLVTGRDAQTGAPAWSYARDLPLCTASAGFPAADGGAGRAFALYRDGDWCSELTTLRPDTGERAAQRNPDVRPGSRMLADADHLALTGPSHAEVLRSPDLVRTLEYGVGPAPAQPGRQPRPGCTYGSFAFAAERLGVVERCPGEATDRLTVLDAESPEGVETPTERFSVLLPAGGAALVALTAGRVAVALPGPPRLLVLDDTGAPAAVVALDVPAADVVDPPGGVAATSGDTRQRYWWTGSRTIALDGSALTPVWTVPGTLGAGTPYAGALLVPVRAGLADVDLATGAVRRILEVTRADPAAPVALATAGRILLEQRGAQLVALRPSG